MNKANNHDEKIAKLTFASVYPHYVVKVTKKGRTEDELRQVIKWLTGYDSDMLDKHLAANSTFVAFFEQASVNSNAHLIKGMICGYRVENIETKLTRYVRYLDKLVDELAKGKKLEKIFRHH